MDERREDDPAKEPTQTRVNYRLPVTIVGDDASGVPFTEATTVENVTRRGAFVSTKRRLTPGALLALHDANETDTRLCYVQVVWVREPGDEQPGAGVKLVSRNQLWMDYLIAHSVQEVDDEEPSVE